MLLNKQMKSKAKKYQDVIRESIEFTYEEMGEDQDVKESMQQPGEPKSYDAIKKSVISMLQRKIDHKNYGKVNK